MNRHIAWESDFLMCRPSTLTTLIPQVVCSLKQALVCSRVAPDAMMFCATFDLVVKNSVVEMLQRC